MGLDELARAGVTPDTVAAMLRGGAAAGWPGKRAGRPAGFSMARADAGDPFVIAVLPGFEKRGLGARCCEAERWVAPRGVGDARPLTDGEPGLRAPDFYAAQGWRAVGREADGQPRLPSACTALGRWAGRGVTHDRDRTWRYTPGLGAAAKPRSGGFFKIVLQ